VADVVLAANLFADAVVAISRVEDQERELKNK
jgi:hypothetical protein